MVEQHCAVLGKPIAHSLSPVLHAAAYTALGLTDWTYERVEVDEAGLPSFLNCIDDTWRGLSLTMPLKRTIQPYGTPRNEWASLLNVANTAVLRWTPDAVREMDLYNTDVYGIARAFQRSFMDRGTVPPRNASMLVLGNGNTAASAVAAAVMMGCVSRVTVAARHPEKTEALRHITAVQPAIREPIQSIGLEDAADRMADADLIVSTIPGFGADIVAQQCTAASMSGTLLDVVYAPRVTKLMDVVGNAGGTVISGTEMLLYQAIAQVLLMTGVDASFNPDQVMSGRGDLLSMLEGAMRTALEEVVNE
ncbi:shikimate dehydrogenase family protein [Bifidobacterium gallicum]|uniref:Shikimate dehydrogenase n=1 Tax=Bifidobacterium gallicum DSM 20093 = LMG 11596 TaxID=561180 RepID=D1NSJ6_9BIFI|nr:hypothetical protein [Bifidobacterium gallicum]EFA23648.1 shikimate dehydrogenase substrate binding domain protein [Bifidobacterium gallicum DSM 20093 = LMG 11596]KFI58709.1 shikimate dehydrogenase [Bifidobacterium gallicum DSM 20093 = LMG 11596]